MNHIRSPVSVRFPSLWRMVAYRCVLIAILCMTQGQVMARDSLDNEPDIDRLIQGKAFVYKLYPKNSAGRGYTLVYAVRAPLNAYWKFKTDFDNDFLLSNKLIKEHRLIEYKKATAITESVYANKPGVRFRWRTTIYPDSHRLEFELLNPGECGQKFHFGNIRVEKLGEYTKITQTAYFDFFGATFWMNYPWYGGMHHQLFYTAKWEQETIRRLIDKYR